MICLHRGLALGLVVTALGGAARATNAAPGGRPANTAVAEPKADEGAERRARALFQQAEASFHAGRYAEALKQYQAGYDAAALPGFLINIAQCQRRLGSLTAALTTYRRFVVVAPDSPYLPQVRSMIAELEKLTSDMERDRLREEETNAAEKRAANANQTRLALAATETKPALVGGTAVPEATGRRRWSGWWWVGGAAAVAIVGGTVAVLATRPGDTTTIHEGTLGTLRR